MIEKIDKILIETEFNRLAERWKKNKEIYSLAALVWNDKNYLKILGMGETALPFILKDLEKTRSNWFHALPLITKENPVKKEDEGNWDKMVTSWLDWAKEKNIAF